MIDLFNDERPYQKPCAMTYAQSESTEIGTDMFQDLSEQTVIKIVPDLCSNADKARRLERKVVRARSDLVSGKNLAIFDFSAY